MALCGLPPGTPGALQPQDSTRSPEAQVPGDNQHKKVTTCSVPEVRHNLTALSAVGVMHQDSTRSPGASPPPQPGTWETLPKQNNPTLRSAESAWGPIVSRQETYTKSAGQEDTHKSPPEDILPPEKVRYKKVGYTLDKTKALKKKLQATQRLFTYTIDKIDKSNITISCQAGLYELFRRAICIYFTHMEDELIQTIAEIHHDREGNIVQDSFKITKVPDNKCEYTISLYHTTSTVMVNGKNYSTFLDKDWQEIAAIIHEINQLNQFTDIEALNDTIQKCLSEVLTCCRDLKSKGPKTSKRTKHKEVLQELMTPCNSNNGMQGEGELHQSAARNTTERTTTPTGEIDDISIPQKEIPPLNEDIRGRIRMPLQTTPEDNSFCASRTVTEALTKDIGDANVLPGTLQDNSADQGENVLPGTPLDKIALTNKQTAITHVKESFSGTTQRAHNANSVRQMTHLHAKETSPRTTQRVHNPTQTEQDTITRNEGPNFNTTAANTNNEDLTFNCRNCRIMRADWSNLLQDVQTREKRLTMAEKSMKSKEKEMERCLAQLESQKALIIGLEAKVADLTASNRLLQQAIETTRTQSATHNHHQPQNSVQDQDLREEIRTLKEEMRLKELEHRLSERIINLEKTMLTSCFSGQQQTQLPSFWAPHPPIYNPGWTSPHLLPTPVHLSMPHNPSSQHFNQYYTPNATQTGRRTQTASGRSDHLGPKFQAQNNHPTTSTPEASQDSPNAHTNRIVNQSHTAPEGRGNDNLKANRASGNWQNRDQERPPRPNRTERDSDAGTSWRRNQNLPDTSWRRNQSNQNARTIYSNPTPANSNTRTKEDSAPLDNNGRIDRR